MSYNFMKFMPCNECCECTRFVDGFDCRENLTDGEWEILSGSWDFVRANPDEHYGFIRWTWGVEHQCEIPESDDDELTVIKWVRTESHRYGATVVERVDAYNIVVEFDTGFGFVVDDQADVRFVALCTHASWYRYLVTAIDDQRVSLYEPTESHEYPEEGGAVDVTVRQVLAKLGTAGKHYYPSSKAGILTTRYHSSSGIVTLSGAAPIEAGGRVGLSWNESARTNMSVSSVVGLLIRVSGGSGDDLPVVDSAVTLHYPLSLIVNLYEGHGFVVNDRVTVNSMHGFVSEIDTLSIVVQWISGTIPSEDDPVTVTPYTTTSPCKESRRPTEDGTTIGEMSLVAAWPDNLLEGSGKIRLTREIAEENFYIDAPAVRASGESNEDRTYRLYFGCPNQNLTNGYYVEWKAVWKTSETGVLTTRTDDDTGVVTLDAALSIEEGDEVNVAGRTNMEVTSVSGLLIGVDGGSGGALPAEDAEVTLTRLDSQAVYGPSGLIGSIIWKSSLSLSTCVWTNLKEEKVVYLGTNMERPLGASTLPGTEIGFQSVQTGQLSSFTITKRQNECPECSQICEACFGGTVPSCMRVTFQDDRVFYLKHMGGCNWQQLCFEISATLSSIEDYYYLTLTAACGSSIDDCGYRAGTYTSDSLGPSDTETVAPGASSSIIQGTQKEGDYTKCELNDDDRWVIAGVDDGLEVVCVFNLTEDRRATDLAVNCHFLRVAKYHAESVSVNDGTHVSGVYSDTHVINNVYYRMANMTNKGDEEIDIQFSTTIPAARTPDTVTIRGRYVTAGGGQIHCYGYNHGTSAWEQLSGESFSNTIGDTTKVFDFTDDYVDETGGVLIRLASVGGIGTDIFRVDFLEAICELEPTSIEIYAWNYDTSSYDRLPNDCQPTQMSAVEANEDQDYTFDFRPNPVYTNAADGEVKVRFLAVGGSAAGDELHLDHAAVTGEFKIDCLTLDEELTHATIPDCACQVIAMDGDDCEEEWDTVTWIEHEVDGGVITKVNKEGPCITYWVDSVSGGGAESGSGTETDPWTNLNTVFSDACIKHICTTACCPKVKVLVKGTIDYAVVGDSFNYLRNLVIEPWGIGTIEINVTGSGNIYAVVSCIGVIWKNTAVACTSTNLLIGTGHRYGYGFRNCGSSTFDNCSGAGTCTTEINVGYNYTHAHGYGFRNCGSSTFDNCSGAGIGTSTGNGWGHGYGYGFSNCGSSTFNDCSDTTGTGTGTGTTTSYGYGYGFGSCSSSTFDSCTGTGTGTGKYSGDAYGYGFDGCTLSVFNTCNGTGNGTCGGFAYVYGCGFHNCDDSAFDTCSGIGTGTGTFAVYGYGFHNCCDSSIFDTCDGQGNIGTPSNGRACGFYGNTGADFNGCDPGVSACFGGGCPANCDI